MIGIEVREGGFFTTIQDAGRQGYQQYGMPTAGAADDFSHRVGNLLVGNPPGEASLEITATGPSLVFTGAALIAVTGGDMGPAIDGRNIPLWESVSVNQGSVLNFQGLRKGFRSYLSVSGGFDLPPVMDSFSTFMRAGVGGYRGRRLKKGDFIPLRNASTGEQLRLRVREAFLPQYPPEQTLRVVMGPQHDHFTRRGIRTFLEQRFVVTAQSDRSGYRLEGPALEHRKNKTEIVSDGMAMGSVQVPGHGRPIVMLHDRPTTGGYPKIATVISADIHKLSQLKPGEALFFSKVSLKKALEAYLIHESDISSRRILERSVSPPEKVGGYSRYRVEIDGKRLDLYLKRK